MWGPIHNLFFANADENCYPDWNDFNETGSYEPPNKLERLANYEIAWIWSAICAFFATVITMYLVYKHSRNFTSKYQQRLIVRCLLMVPIYAIDSFLSFRFYFYSVYFDLARDCYEAFVINNFFCLMIEYAGGYDIAKQTIVDKKKIKLIFPLNCFTITAYRGTIRTLKKITLQYVIVRPFLSLVAVILQANHVYCMGNWNLTRGYIYISFVLFCSVTSAMYALIMFYNLFKINMAQHKPLGKFLAIKFVIFLSFWQSVAVAGLVYLNVVRATAHWSTDNISSGVTNVLICSEMVIASIVHIWVFDYQPYVKEGTKTPVFTVLFRYIFSFKDISKDIKRSFFPKKKKGKKPKMYGSTSGVTGASLVDGAAPVGITPPFAPISGPNAGPIYISEDPAVVEEPASANMEEGYASPYNTEMILKTNKPPN
eukprot:Phypoly_transcript_08711.p1 GENE.Phypoly_transcript_08711~~Phypoly_transcript_08711.p1  ORF type:complete len:427 (+),score=45.53 Phypoly_transcript_08711:108-1388(+)